MTTIIEFLNARLDEDEAAAQAVTAAGGHGGWEALPLAELDGRRALAWGSFIFAVMDPVPEGRACAEHAARHDPARVLREIAAKRSIIEICVGQGYVEDGPVPWSAAPPEAPVTWFTLAELAAVYADHSDYRQEWKVT